MLIAMPKVPLGKKDGPPTSRECPPPPLDPGGTVKASTRDEVCPRELELVTIGQSALRLLSGRVAAQVGVSLLHLHPDGH